MGAPEPGPAPRPTAADGPLHDLRVVDVSTVVAGPGCARYLADFGADVIKVERPGTGDTTRTMGWVDPADDVTLWWKLAGRNKRTAVLDLKDPGDLAHMRRLVASADVLVENFRPGTLERLGLAPDDLIAANPKLVVTRVTGFGQDGPYAGRPGFATLAEAMSGFASINGEPDGAPLLPPIALTDEVTALVAAFATMVALHSGTGQVVDVNLLESLSQLMGPMLSLWRTRGELPERLGSGIAYSVPRGTYRCADGRWVAISTSAESVAVRVMDLIGLGGQERFAGFAGRIAHREEIDACLARWCAERPLADVLATFEAAHAAAAPVYTMDQLAEDPHAVARGLVAEVDGFPMQGLVARLSATPGRLRWPGRPLGADTAQVLAELDDPAPDA
ncbi:CoA transferase [Aquihabitans sp. G128]|uniref:CaiB/BaiF CoA transferase family protein n=1 Tax=Aquihabitans sp. G128 TaxID=2849779 RepID=UPI001C24DDD3|nr:CoA transferase [Aquihabitans sp. G128]QXC60030.1 CoA transferase [Aquihabitans sp. G128]